MSRAATDVSVEPASAADSREWLPPVLPVVIAVAAVTLLLAWIVSATASAWHLLGAGRGLIPEAYYPLWGFVLVLGTTLGQAAGWAGASAVLAYLLMRLGVAAARSWTVAMTVVYLGLAGFPLVVYGLVFGRPLLGLPRLGLEEWLLANHPDAHLLLVTLRPVVEFSVIPLAVVFVAVLWRTADAPTRRRGVQTILAVALLATSLAVALSLAIHATLVRIRL